jgi:hypothetical protein
MPLVEAGAQNADGDAAAIREACEAATPVLARPNGDRCGHRVGVRRGQSHPR